MYRTNADKNIENPDRAIASFVLNPKKTMQKGTTTPPPPIPPIFDSVRMIMSRMSPMNSKPRIGKIDL
jgi:hypothetical protein